MHNESSGLLGALGLCRKAGKLLYGYDRVAEAVLRGKVSLVLLAADASPRTAQHMMVMPLTGEELATLTPRPAAVFAVTEANLARLCANYLGSA